MAYGDIMGARFSFLLMLHIFGGMASGQCLGGIYYDLVLIVKIRMTNTRIVEAHDVGNPGTC